MVCGGLRWFAVVCGGLAGFLTAHGHTDVLSTLSSQILVVVCGGLRWCVVVCGGFWWFAVVCGGLRWFVVVCGGLSFSHTQLGYIAIMEIYIFWHFTSLGPRHDNQLFCNILNTFKMKDGFSPVFDKKIKLIVWTCIFFRESLTWRDAVRAVIPRKSP